jgi:hypothetical protein
MGRRQTVDLCSGRRIRKATAIPGEAHRGRLTSTDGRLAETARTRSRALSSKASSDTSGHGSPRLSVQKADPVAQLLPGRWKTAGISAPVCGMPAQQCGHCGGGVGLWQRRFGKRDGAQPVIRRARTRRSPRQNTHSSLSTARSARSSSSSRLPVRRRREPAPPVPCRSVGHQEVSRRPADLFRRSPHHARWQARIARARPAALRSRSGKAVAAVPRPPECRKSALRPAPASRPRERGPPSPVDCGHAEALPAGVEVRRSAAEPLFGEQNSQFRCSQPVPCSRPATTMAASRGGSASARICLPRDVSAPWHQLPRDR